MSTLFIGQNKIELPTVDSTNNFAANLIKKTNVLDGTVILSEKQTNGRGQAGNSWLSAQGDNITCSYILKPNFLKIEEQFYLSMITSLAIVNVLSNLNITSRIKWPNDILIGSRKVCGILIENSLSGNIFSYSIIGIGLNVNQTSFETGLSATSIANVIGQIQVKDRVLRNLSAELERYYLRLKAGKKSEIKEEYLTSLHGFQQVLKFEDCATGQQFHGEITDISERGPVLIRTGNEVKSYLFKQVKFLE